MDKLKEQFKADFKKSDKPDLSFDLRQLEPNTKKTKHEIRPYKAVLIGVAWLLGIFICLPAAAFLVMSLRIDESVKFSNRQYSMNELKVAESNTFRKLNDISYPSGQIPTESVIRNDEKEAYDSFTNTTYHSLVDSSKQDNMSYSVVGLYSLLNELSNASSREDLSYHLNELLGLDETSRVSFYEKIMKANSFAEQDSTIQLKNAAFFDTKYDYNQTFVNTLTKLYCEAYQLTFANEASRIVEWVNNAVNSRGFIDQNFLEMDDETRLYLFSTLYFKNAWANKYLSEDNIEDDFHLANGSIEKTTFMRHSYFAKTYFDYGSYISVRDYYYGGNASVTYLVPKKVEDNIFELTKNDNIFEENPIYKKYAGAADSEPYKHFKINLKTPKFNIKSDVDFRPCLESLGFGSIFDRYTDSFKNAFSGEAVKDKPTFLQTLKQRNEVEFNEDGSIVRSVSMAGMACGEAAPMQPDGTLDVDLNQPFIYIIRDVNNNPIFVGHVDNPRA